jgi:hypothetical protein
MAYKEQYDLATDLVDNPDLYDYSFINNGDELKHKRFEFFYFIFDFYF